MATLRPRTFTVTSVLDADRCIYSGMLSKRCTLSWRPRYVELISEPAECSGSSYSFQLLMFDPRKQMLKDRIRMEDIVTIRASRDCCFQIFLSNGKILQFRTETNESQACWMAMLKVGLGRGNIFHVRVNTPFSSLEHALLYSIGVNLPAHRIGQLDRVIVLASPVNDINMHAWDLNRIKRFVQLDIGIRIDLCPSCMGMSSPVFTLILKKQFIKDCINFLCREAHIMGEPLEENGLLIYNVPHKCGGGRPTCQSDAPPPYAEREEGWAKVAIPDTPSEHLWTEAANNSEVTQTRVPKGSRPRPPAVPQPAASHDSHTTAVPVVKFTDDDWHHYDTSADDDLPPRTIPRRNYECSIPAKAQPYINFSPHLFNGSSNLFAAPYQISSRIIITDSGEVQYERNILGTPPTMHGGFHFNGDIPLPTRRKTTTQVKLSSTQRSHHWEAGSKEGSSLSTTLPPSAPVRPRGTPVRSTVSSPISSARQPNSTGQYPSVFHTQKSDETVSKSAARTRSASELSGEYVMRTAQTAHEPSHNDQPTEMTEDKTASEAGTPESASSSDSYEDVRVSSTHRVHFQTPPVSSESLTKSEVDTTTPTPTLSLSTVSASSSDSYEDVRVSSTHRVHFQTPPVSSESPTKSEADTTIPTATLTLSTVSSSSSDLYEDVIPVRVSSMHTAHAQAQPVSSEPTTKQRPPVAAPRKGRPPVAPRTWKAAEAGGLPQSRGGKVLQSARGKEKRSTTEFVKLTPHGSVQFTAQQTITNGHLNESELARSISTSKTSPTISQSRGTDSMPSRTTVPQRGGDQAGLLDREPWDRSSAQSTLSPYRHRKRPPKPKPRVKPIANHLQVVVNVNHEQTHVRRHRRRRSKSAVTDTGESEML